MYGHHTLRRIIVELVFPLPLSFGDLSAGDRLPHVRDSPPTAESLV